MGDEPVRVELQPPAHPIELEHRRNAIGFFQAHVLDVPKHGFAARERAERRKDRQHVGDVAAIHVDAAQLHAVVLHANRVSVGIVRHRETHLAHDLQERALGVIGELAGQLLQPAKQHVGGVDRGNGQPERGGADVRRKLDRRRAGALTGLDFEPAVVGRDVHVQIEGAHHLDREPDIGALVEFAFDLDDRALLRERREQQQAGDPLRQRSGNDDRSAAGAPRLDRDGRAALRGRESHAHVRERVEQRPDRPTAKILLRGEGDRRVGERREADHEVERRSGAADRDDLTLDVIRTAGDEQRLPIDLDLRAERAQYVNRVLHVAGIGQTEDAARSRCERGQN